VAVANHFFVVVEVFVVEDLVEVFAEVVVVCLDFGFGLDNRVSRHTSVCKICNTPLVYQNTFNINYRLKKIAIFYSL